MPKRFPVTAKLINYLLQLVLQLHQQLLKETELLTQFQDPEQLTEIATQKKRLATEIEQLYQQLGQLLAAEQLPNNANGIQTYLRRAQLAGLDAAISLDNWQQLHDISIQCQALNEQNGASIELLSRHANRSLNILKGKPQTADTYGRNGATQSSSATIRTLISV